MLDRDGIESTKYHRGVYVEPFDAESILDDFEIMGLLSGVAVRRLAERKDPETIEALHGLVDELRACDPHELRVARQYTRAQERRRTTGAAWPRETSRAGGLAE